MSNSLGIDQSHASIRYPEKDQELKNLYQAVRSELKSSTSRDKCLVRFHNCTPYEIEPIWIDHNGQPIRYETLKSKQSRSYTTYVSHLWLFKIKSPITCGNGFLKSVPEETVDYIHTSISTNNGSYTTSQQIETYNEGEIQDSQVCAMCSYIANRYPKQEPPRVSCLHLEGAMFSMSDTFQCHRPSYLYSCNENTHRHDHSNKERNIFLLKPFFTLKERCFITLEKHIDHRDIVDMNIPKSLQKEYFLFIVDFK